MWALVIVVIRHCVGVSYIVVIRHCVGVSYSGSTSLCGRELYVCGR